MPTTSITGRVKTIVGLTNEDCATLAADKISSQEDLSFIEFEDLNGDITIVKRRKLGMIIKYLSAGNELTATTTMEEIRNSVKAGIVPSVATTTGGTTHQSVDSGAPKVYTDPLDEFSGDPLDYEEWEGKSSATLRQTVYRRFLDKAPDATKPAEVARNQELYNMILSAVRSGHALNRVEKLKEGKRKTRQNAENKQT